MAITKEMRQYVITYVKRKYEWQIKDLQKRVEELEKKVATLVDSNPSDAKRKK